MANKVGWQRLGCACLTRKDSSRSFYELWADMTHPAEKVLLLSVIRNVICRLSFFVVITNTDYEDDTALADVIDDMPRLFDRVVIMDQPHPFQ